MAMPEPREVAQAQHDALTLAAAAAKIAQCAHDSLPSTLEPSSAPVWERLRAAAESGALRTRHPETLLVEDFAAWPDPARGALVCTLSDLNAWLEREGVPYRLPSERPQEASEEAQSGHFGSNADAGSPAQVPHAASESDEERQRRRYERLTALGGGRVRNDAGGWKASGMRGALAELVREEKAAGRTWSDNKDVRFDLNEEAQRRSLRLALPGG